jgi:PAS domain S-box-containing protein
MKKIFKWLAFYWPIFWAGLGVAQVPSYRQFSLKQGLPQSEISSIYEDSRGLVWVGTRGGGLVCFNGSKPIQIYNQQNSSLSNDFISEIRETPQGQLLVGQTYQGIQQFDNRNFQPELRQRWFGFQELLGIEVMGNSPIAICDQVVYLMGKDSVHSKILFTFPQPLSSLEAHTLVHNRWLLLAVPEGLWMLDLKAKARSLFLSDSVLGGKKVVGMNAVQSHSAILISSDGHKSMLHFDSGWPMPDSWIPIQGVQLLPGEQITTVTFEIGQRFQWLATSQIRIISVSGEVLDLTSAAGNRFHQISSLLLDKNGTLWIGTEGSGIIQKLAHSAYSFENIPEFANTHLRAVYTDRSQRLLAGGKETGLLVRQPVKMDRVETYLPKASIFSISSGSHDAYVGTSQGLVTLGLPGFQVKSSQPEPGKVIQLHPLSDDRLLVGTYGNGLWLRQKDGKINRIGNEPVLQYIYGFQEVEPGLFWIPSNTGLWELRLSDLSVRRLSVPGSVGSQFFLITRDKQGRIWLATPSGLAIKSGHRWLKLGVEQGLSSTLIYTLNADSLGHIWVGTNHGLDRILLGKNDQLKEIQNFGPEEGYDGYEANMRGSWIQGNWLFVCSIQGLMAMPVRSKVLDPLPPRPEIYSLQITNRSGKWTDTIPGWNPQWYLTGRTGLFLQDRPQGIKIHFGSINPVYPARLFYSFRQEGSTSGWSPLSKEQEAILVNPGSGVHTIWVRSSYDGVNFSTPSSFSFEIETPWYMGQWVTTIFLICALVLIAFTGWFFYRPGLKAQSLRDEVLIPERMSQVILLVGAVFYPLTEYVASLVDPSVYFHPVVLVSIGFCVFGFFLAGQLIPGLRKYTRVFMILSFLFFILDTAFGLVMSNVAPYHVVTILFVSSLGFLVFDRLWQVLTYGIALTAFAFWCIFHFPQPNYSPIPFSMGAISASLILVVVHIAKRSSDQKLSFANEVVHSGPVLILGFERNGNLIFVSENIRKILGYSPEVVSGSFWWSDIVAKSMEVERLKRFIFSRPESPLKIYLRKQDGQVRRFQLSCRKLDSENSVIHAQDITNQESLEVRFEHLIENAPDAIYQTDFSGKLVYANPQTAFILGYSREELVGRVFADFVREDVRESVADFYRDQVRSKTAITYHEFPVIAKGGQIRWLGFQVSLLMDDNGNQVDGFLSIGRDITERLEAEQLIQVQHKNITDSLTYANRIKSAILPGKSVLKAAFTDFEVYNQPKDIIGGDFYWYTPQGRKHLFVLGDCTGHGVPGAFMTTIAVGLLRQIVRDEPGIGVEDILGLFNRSLVRLLGANSEMESLDFVELALVQIDPDAKTLQFLSSGIELHRLRKGEIETFHAGSRGYNYRYDYCGHSFELAYDEQDTFFLFTDGMFDQIGGPQRKRLTRKKLVELIRQSDAEGLDSKLDQIRIAVEAWQGTVPQIDDRMMAVFRC